MKNTTFIGLLFLNLIYQGCEDDKDTSPPYVFILYPQESSLVSEIITVRCDASDNDSIKFVELWIDSLSTGIKDSSSPYEFSWNTVPYQDSTEYLLMVKAEDINNNISFSNNIIQKRKGEEEGPRDRVPSHKVARRHQEPEPGVRARPNRRSGPAVGRPPD